MKTAFIALALLPAVASAFQVGQAGELVIPEVDRYPVVVLADVGRDRGSSYDTVEAFRISTRTFVPPKAGVRTTYMYRIGAGKTQSIAETNTVSIAVPTASGWTVVPFQTAPRFTAMSGTASAPVLTVEISPYAGNSVVIEGCESLGGAWSPAAPGHRFFRAVQK